MAFNASIPVFILDFIVVGIVQDHGLSFLKEPLINYMVHNDWIFLCLDRYPIDRVCATKINQCATQSARGSTIK